MVGTIGAILAALGTVSTWPTIGFIVLGTLIGMSFGALPGLGGIVALVLLLPLTFGMEATSAMALFGATLGGAAFGGSISAILINTPGTAPNAATCFDGYPMARQGRAGEAIGVSATASALGALFGIVILVLLIPVARIVVLAFSSPEFFWLAVLGLTTIAVVSEGRLLKGLISGGFGLMLTFIGFSRVSSELRYTFGTNYLWDGVQLVPVLVGLFAIGESINLLIQGGTISKDEMMKTHGGVLRGIKHVFQRPTLFFRSAATGTVLGLIPGVGGSVANFVSYMSAMQTSNDPGSFGTGNPDGIIASEAANDAKDGGALLPTVVFGIPGSPIMAVILGGFTLHGLEPGPELLTQDQAVLFSLILSLLIANVLTSSIGIVLANHLAKITRVPVTSLVPIIIVMSFLGVFALRNSLGDVLLAIVFGVFGYGMIAFNYSRVAVVLALVLGPIAERAFLQSVQISDVGYMIFFVRPISMILIFLTLLSLALPVIRSYRQRAIGGGDQ